MTEREKSLSQFNKEVTHRYMIAWEQADLTTLRELITEDFVNHSPPLPANRQEMLERAVEHRYQFPTGKYTLHKLVAEDDLVFAFGNYQGTHDGEAFNGIPASGAEVNFDFSILLRLVEGKIVERWGTADDVMGMLVPLGFKLVPPE